MAGKPQTLATTSAFEILGPVMVGPSSSHTAGALRCAQVAASLLEGRITKVTFGLWNSFAHTYRGHGTDRALVAGILGLDTDDENIKQAFDLAREQGLEYHFDIKGDDASIHPNTVDIEMVDDTGATAQVRGESLGGGKMRISRINGVGVDISGMYSTLFVAHKDVPGVLAALTNLLAYAHVNIAFCRTYRTEVGGQAYSVFETDGAPDDTVIPMLRKLDNVDYATFIELPGSASSLSPGVSAKEIFDDGEQLLDACEEQGLSIGAVMAVREARLTGEAHAVAAMRRVLVVELQAIGKRQHAAGHNTRGSCRRSCDDHTHRGGTLEHGHRAGHGVGLDDAHQAFTQIVAACGIDEFSLAADKPAE